MGGRQFPEPLEILINVDTIKGGTEEDIYTINDFNHYIGMKKIKRDSIPELKIMPYILAWMIFGGIITLFYRKVFMIYLGVIDACFVGIAGLFDYYKWLHNFGTDLDKSAPLFNPDTDFQPPLFACKDILNVTTCSWPHFGSYLLFISLALLLYIIYYEKKERKEKF